jgi:hypothetical protein
MSSFFTRLSDENDQGHPSHIFHPNVHPFVESKTQHLHNVWSLVSGVFVFSFLPSLSLSDPPPLVSSLCSSGQTYALGVLSWGFWARLCYAWQLLVVPVLPWMEIKEAAMKALGLSFNMAHLGCRGSGANKGLCSSLKHHGWETNKEQAVMRGQILRYYEAMMMQNQDGHSRWPNVWLPTLKTN